MFTILLVRMGSSFFPLIIIICLVIGVIFFFYRISKKYDYTAQTRLRKFQKQYLKNQYKNSGNIASQDVSEEEKINPQSSYLIGEDGTIIRDENDSRQTIKYIPMSNDNSKIQVTYMLAEDAANKEAVLRKRLLSGEQLDFIDCNYMLDSTDDVEVWKAICKNHIQDSVYPPINIIENFNSERSIEFYDMIYRIINLCISGDNGWNVELPAEFVKNTILFSTNVDALYVIADFQEKDIHNPNYDNKPNVDLFNEIKKLAYNRYNYLISRRK